MQYMKPSPLINDTKHLMEDQSRMDLSADCGD